MRAVPLYISFGNRIAQEKDRKAAYRAWPIFVGYTKSVRVLNSTIFIFQNLEQDPAIRTNPIIGWMKVYGGFNQIQGLDEIAKQESDEILRYMDPLVTNNHDLRVRFE